MGSTDAPPTDARWFLGIGVSSYADSSLDRSCLTDNVRDVGGWFVDAPTAPHRWGARELAENPTWAQMSTGLADFFDERDPDDIVVIYIASHGDIDDAGDAYVYGSDTPATKIAGRALLASELGRIIGSNAPHRVLVLLDTCVSGTAAAAMLHKMQQAATGGNTRTGDFTHVVISSAREDTPAEAGGFAAAFLAAVREERWTGSDREWLSTEVVVDSINGVFDEAGSWQQAVARFAGTESSRFLPNPNAGTRRLGQLMGDDEFAAHFDPASRGVARGETGSYFTGRTAELRRIRAWLDGTDPMLVITGSPGIGKSALLSRVIVLADDATRPDQAHIAALPDDTVPAAGAVAGRVWCRHKSSRGVVAELAVALGGSASTPAELLALANQQGPAVIAVDALDEAVGGEATMIAYGVLRRLAKESPTRLLVATRPQRGVITDTGTGDPTLGGGLLGDLGVAPDDVIDLDRAEDRHQDIVGYIRARLLAAADARGERNSDLGGGDLDNTRDLDDAAVEEVDRLARSIADAADGSFLVASIAARTLSSRTGERAEDYRLPSAVHEALSDYLAATGDEERSRAVLRPLAWSVDAGLPWGRVWPAVATALTDNPPDVVGDADIRRVLTAAGDLVATSEHLGTPVYRLFHEALAETLRESTAHDRPWVAVADALRTFAEGPLSTSTGLHIDVDGPPPANGEDWSTVPRYVRMWLPQHELLAERVDNAVELLLDPRWERQHRADLGDPLAAAPMVTAVEEQLLARRSPELFELCALAQQHGRAMTAALPALIDVVARADQLERATALAANLDDVADRALGHRVLATAYGRAGDVVGARRAVDEVERSAAAFHPDHRAMAWAWVTEACLAADDLRRARRAAMRAGSAAADLLDPWDRANGLFWAAHSARACGDARGREAVVDRLHTLVQEGFPTFRNQFLQAASVAGDDESLRGVLDAVMQDPPEAHQPVRHGNLALALADAGLVDELKQLRRHLGDRPPAREPDAQKRWTWALALAGDLPEAVAALDDIGDLLEESKAITRIAEVVTTVRPEREGDGDDGDASAATETALAALAARAEDLLGQQGEPRTRARLIRALWLAGRRDDALDRAEEAIARPASDDVMEEVHLGVETEQTGGWAAAKRGRRTMVTSRGPTADEQRAIDVDRAVEVGDLVEARRLLDKIRIPAVRAAAAVRVASATPEQGVAIDTWLRALPWARRAGRATAMTVIAEGTSMLRSFALQATADELSEQLVVLDVRWELERFAEQYEALRGLDAGRARTGRMGTLMLVPIRLAETHEWTSTAVRYAWDREEDGTRAFALGLMIGDPALADEWVLVDAIRGSRSAFEQYSALQAALASSLGESALEHVLDAVRDELDGVPRPDGSSSKLDGSRTRLATKLLDQHRA